MVVDHSLQIQNLERLYRVLKMRDDGQVGDNETNGMEEIRKQREIQEETEPKYNHSFHFRSCEHMRCLTPTPRGASHQGFGI